MILLFVAFAAAQDLPWVCPVVTMPEEARLLYEEDGGLYDTFTLLWAEAESWVDEACAWEVTYPGDGETLSTCTTAAGAWVSRYEAELYLENDYASYDMEEMWTLEVMPPDGAASWSRLTLTTDSTTRRESAEYAQEASWSGSPLGLPADQDFQISQFTVSRPYTGGDVTITTPACTWTYGSTNGETDTVRTGGVAYYVNYMGQSCDEAAGSDAVASVDSALYGAVDPETWALLEVDQDGYSEASGDCDDTDPTVHPCAADIAFDGIDQNCDGLDAADADMDGFDGAAGGGTDCDDTDPDVRPGAHETPVDGIDQDCDGADDVDADGDGYTADGDNQMADCDDTDADVRPEGVEVAYDGVDQDCDGSDLVDVDADGFAAIEAGGDDCDDSAPRTFPGAYEPPCDDIDQDCDGADACAEAEPASRESGCAGGSGGLLLLIPLLRRRR